jgi:glyoxylase-like metal-dependent hydrolase (beta-lactamase superfamily II)
MGRNTEPLGRFADAEFLQVHRGIVVDFVSTRTSTVRLVRIHDLNCGTLNVPGGPPVFGVPFFVCRCLLIETSDRLVAVDTGIGTKDIKDPEQRLGKDWLAQVNPALDPEETLLARVADLGFSPRDLTDVIITHHHRDHVGGLADFPWSRVHASTACRATVEEGESRVVPAQWSHGVTWAPAPTPAPDWQGLPMWTLDGIPESIRLVSLDGHSPGHAGVLIDDPALGQPLLHVGDAIHHHGQLACNTPPAVEAFAAATEHDHAARLRTQRRLAALVAGGSAHLVNAHDPSFTDVP